MILKLRTLLATVVIIYSQVSFSSNNVMNGYTINQFGNFVDNWKLVTSRYRKDTGEMRLTYANKEAWDTLNKNSSDFPDGSVFAKLCVMTQDDPAFPSSSVPSGTRRVQFMVKDRTKHASTDGWGYALFDSSGHTYPGDLKESTDACVACHRIIPERGFIFSQPMFNVIPKIFDEQTNNWEKKFSFKIIKVNELPKKIRKLIPTKFSTVYSLTSELSKNLFSGTLDEIRPLLIKKVLATNEPAILISENGRKFSLVIRDPRSNKCDSNQIAIQSFHTVPNTKHPILKLNFCTDKTVDKNL